MNFKKKFQKNSKIWLRQVRNKNQKFKKFMKFQELLENYIYVQTYICFLVQGGHTKPQGLVCKYHGNSEFLLKARDYLPNLQTFHKKLVNIFTKQGFFKGLCGFGIAKLCFRLSALWGVFWHSEGHYASTVVHRLKPLFEKEV